MSVDENHRVQGAAEHLMLVLGVFQIRIFHEHMRI